MADADRHRATEDFDPNWIKLAFGELLIHKCVCFYLFLKNYIDIIIILYFSPNKHCLLTLLNYQLHIIGQHDRTF